MNFLGLSLLSSLLCFWVMPFPPFLRINKSKQKKRKINDSAVVFITDWTIVTGVMLFFCIILAKVLVSVLLSTISLAHNFVFHRSVRPREPSSSLPSTPPHPFVLYGIAFFHCTLLFLFFPTHYLLCCHQTSFS